MRNTGVGQAIREFRRDAYTSGKSTEANQEGDKQGGPRSVGWCKVTRGTTAIDQ